jgi:NADH-quinone oxidoreductase subunit E
MKFSDQFEVRFVDMLTHYPTKRSALVPTLLYAQDEVGYLSDEVILELATRLDLTELEVRNVISYYSMLTTKPFGPTASDRTFVYQPTCAPTSTTRSPALTRR